MCAPRRPDRMFRNGRPEDQDFALVEKLFRRYLQAHFIGQVFSPLGFQFHEESGQSVNRQKYGPPEDVLFSEDARYAGCGVLSFEVRDLPASFPPEEPRYTFFPRHLPQEDNYAHSEVWCDRLPQQTGGYVVPSSTVKKKLRAQLSHYHRLSYLGANQERSTSACLKCPTSGTICRHLILKLESLRTFSVRKLCENSLAAGNFPHSCRQGRDAWAGHAVAGWRQGWDAKECDVALRDVDGREGQTKV